MNLPKSTGNSSEISVDSGRRRAAFLYREALEAGSAVRSGPGNTIVHVGMGDGAGDAAAFAEAVLRAATSPAKVLKRSHINLVFRARVGGCEVLVKRYALRGAGHRVSYWRRASRGRRAWAAATVLHESGIPTPRPVGFIEERRAGFAGTSYAVAEFLEDAVPARRWIKAWLHQRPAPFRDAFRCQLFDALTTLYRHGIYHGDTKSSNLLLRHPEDPEQRTLYWIDLDSMQFGVRLTRRRILRNLVQLNGSIGSKLSDEDRLAFLEDLSDMFPWVAEPWVAARIRTWTMERLQRERRGECGP